MKQHLVPSTALFALLTGSTFASQNVTINSGAIAWMLILSALVLSMVPELAMSYGGLGCAKNVMGPMMHSLPQWTSWLFSVSF